MPKMGALAALCVLLGFFLAVFAAAQDNSTGGGETNRGSIPEILLRPQRGETPRYPVDTVIGPLGRGEASEEAYLFARKAAAALMAGNKADANLQAMNSVSLEAFISAIAAVSPRNYRLGSGREEPDGAVSFLIRFLGREMGITGELYIRPQGYEPPGDSPRQPADEADDVEILPADGSAETTAPADTAGTGEDAGAVNDAGTPVNTGAMAEGGPVIWQFEDLILEEARERAAEGDNQRFDFPPYERFF
jgi:hypothetical protein